MYVCMYEHVCFTKIVYCMYVCMYVCTTGYRLHQQMRASSEVTWNHL